MEKRILLERYVTYASWENLIYALVVVGGLFVGTTFFTDGGIALFLSIVSGILVLALSVAVLIRKGLVYDRRLYRGYFLFGKLLLKTEIENPATNRFTLVRRSYRQKYIGEQRRVWDYHIDSFDLHFIDDHGALRDVILRCMKKKTAERAVGFLGDTCFLEYIAVST